MTAIPSKNKLLLPHLYRKSSSEPPTPLLPLKQTLRKKDSLWNKNAYQLLQLFKNALKNRTFYSDERLQNADIKFYLIYIYIFIYHQEQRHRTYARTDIQTMYLGYTKRSDKRPTGHSAALRKPLRPIIWFLASQPKCPEEEAIVHYLYSIFEFCSVPRGPNSKT